MKTALIFGATGFIGSHLLENLLANPDYERVTVVVRRPLNISNPNLKVLIGDLDKLPSLKSQLVADEVFIALGTTKAYTPDEAEYYKIDHDYPVLAARLAKENGAKSVFLVSAVGADAGSSLFYIRTKGEVERDVIALGYNHTHIFEPSMILGQRKEERAMEKVFIKIFEVINPIFIGSTDRYRGIDGKDIVKAMIASAKKQSDKVKIYQWREMTALLKV